MRSATATSGISAHRSGALVAIPLAGDDTAALAVAAQLVRDAGFEPVVVGPLSRAREFDVGTYPYTHVLTAAELRQSLGLRIGLRRPVAAVAPLGVARR